MDWLDGLLGGSPAVTGGAALALQERRLKAESVDEALRLFHEPVKAGAIRAA